MSVLPDRVQAAIGILADAIADEEGADSKRRNTIEKGVTLFIESQMSGTADVMIPLEDEWIEHDDLLQ